LFSHAQAQNSPNQSQPPKNQGLTVSPAFQLVTLNFNQSERSLNFKITNNRETTQNINLSTADFNTLGESGGLVFVGTNPTDIQKKYGLAHWLRLDKTKVTIKPKQTVTIKTSVLNEADLTPGGHYGALLLSIGTESGQGQNKISLQPIASSLLFVTKLGGDTHKLELSSVDAKHNLLKLPSEVNLRFKNNGNTHLTPRGSVTLTAPDGKVIKRGIINESSNMILPESYRIYTVSLNDIASSSMIGKYKLNVDFRFDGIDKYRGYQSSMFYVPMQLILALILVILTIVFGILFALKKPHAKRYVKHLKKYLKKTT
jgi:hypothetical protein